jgi:hypothetical protein
MAFTPDIAKLDAHGVIEHRVRVAAAWKAIELAAVANRLRHHAASS